MGMSIEWGHARTVRVYWCPPAMTREAFEEANVTIDPGNGVLSLDLSGGGGAAIEGTAAELEDFLRDALSKVRGEQ